MPSLGLQAPLRRPSWNGPKPSKIQRLQRWIKKKLCPPPHMVKRPLQFRLPKKVQMENGFATPVVWLTDRGELRLGDPDNGRIIGKTDTVS